jgi:glyoxylase-like metal-dependent hydrolase (beta-lactamase superfamily II)
MIKIEKFVFNNFQVNTYILYDETNEAIIIDPACDNETEVGRIKEFISLNNLSLKLIANTHGHIDHILGVKAVSEEFSVPFYLHEGDNFLLATSIDSAEVFGFNLNENPLPDKNINESDFIKFGNSSLQIIHVPGHSPGSLVYYSERDSFIIVGDVLFNGSIGRTDLPGGNYETLIKGIKEKLLILPNATLVYTGHGNHTTIGQEYDTNPFLN